MHPHICDKKHTLVFSDSCLVVVCKPSGLLSVPGRGEHKQDCLIHRVQAEGFPDALIVHRLDCDTSGLLVLARGKEMHRRLSILFQKREVEKRYVAVVDGRLSPDKGQIDLPLLVDWPNRPLHKVDFDNGKPSLTFYQELGFSPERHCSRVALVPATGRTHQLRVHMQAIGHPILGDSLYAPPEVLAKAERLLLHAERLAFPHPENGQPLGFDYPAEF